MKTHKVVQFSQAYIFGVGISTPACLVGSQVIPCDGTSVVAPSKRAVRKDFSKASSTERNASPMYGVTLWTKSHSYWRYFCRPA